MIITLSCDRVFSSGCINENAGIFGVLDEKLPRLKTGSIIPAIDNTACHCRRTARCNIDCNHAIHTTVAGGKVSYRRINMKM
jgi:hypothetical protein